MVRAEIPWVFPIGVITYSQMIADAPPEIIPASAPHFVVRFQKRAKSTRGANAAPKPAQAKETILNTVLLGFQANRTETTEITATVTRATIILFLGLISFLINLLTIFSETLEAAARSWESEVDIIDARIPEMISPATIAKMKKDGAVVSSEVLVKICTALNCTMDDIVEII